MPFVFLFPLRFAGAKMLFRLARLFSRVFPPLDFPAGLRQRVDLPKASANASENEFLTFSLFASFALSLPSAFFNFAFVPVIFVISFAFFLSYPSMHAKRRAREIERELPVALRVIGTQLEFEMPFEDVLREAGRESSGALKQELTCVNNAIDAGSSPVNALNSFAERVDSVHVKRAVMQLVFCFENGGSTDGLRNLADELIEGQKNAARTFNAKSSFFGLLFISLSTIVPALYSAYLIVGSYFLEVSLSPAAVLLSFVLFFPLVDLLVLLYLKEKKPVLLGG